jgi:NADH:ubiquinone oxidoreductase subunit E
LDVFFYLGKRKESYHVFHETQCKRVHYHSKSGNPLAASPVVEVNAGLAPLIGNALHEEEHMELSALYAMLEDKESCPDQLIEVLQEMQVQFHYLPENGLRIVAERLGLPLIQVFQVATFYKAFSLTPRGRHLLTICMGTACHVRGAPKLLDTVAGHLNISPGETTPDRAFTLERVNCLGCCALGPVAVLDGVYRDHITPGTLHNLINAVRKRDKKGMKKYV